MQRVKIKLTEQQKKLQKREAAAAKRQMPRLKELADKASKPKYIQLVVSEEIYDALKVYSDEHGVTMSDVLREAGLKKIGRKDLVGTMPSRGRPRSE